MKTTITHHRLSSGEFNRVRDDALEAKFGRHWFPNQVWSNKDGSIIIGVAVRSSTKGEDFAVSLDMVHFLSGRGGRHKMIILADRNERTGNLTPQRQMSLDQYLKMIENEPARNGKYGRYHWVSADGSCVENDAGTSTVPFN